MIVECVEDDKALPVVRQVYRYPCNLLKRAHSKEILQSLLKYFRATSPFFTSHSCFDEYLAAQG